MKNILLSLAALTLAYSAPSFAAAPKKAVTTTTTTRTVTEEPSGGGGIWLGVALNNLIVKPGLLAVTMPASISAQFGLSHKSAIQAYVGLFGVTGTVTFGVGADYKYSVIGDTSKGFHVGGGFGLGTFAGAAAAAGSTFFVNFAGTMGLHFQLADGVLVSSDFGPLLTVGGGTDFVLASRSALLGLSLMMRL